MRTNRSIPGMSAGRGSPFFRPRLGLRVNSRTAKRAEFRIAH